MIFPTNRPMRSSARLPGAARRNSAAVMRAVGVRRFIGAFAGAALQCLLGGRLFAQRLVQRGPADRRLFAHAAQKGPQDQSGQTLEKTFVRKVVRQLVIHRQHQRVRSQGKACGALAHRPFFHRVGHAALRAHTRLRARHTVRQQSRQDKVVIQQKTGQKAIFTLQLLAQAAVIGAVGVPLAHLQLCCQGQNIAEHVRTPFPLQDTKHIQYTISCAFLQFSRRIFRLFAVKICIFFIFRPYFVHSRRGDGGGYGFFSRWSTVSKR